MVVPGVVRRALKALPTILQAVALVALLHLVGQVGTCIMHMYCMYIAKLRIADILHEYCELHIA